MAQHIQRLNPPGLFDSTQNHHSQVSIVEPGRLAFFSGQVAWTAEAVTAPTSLREQAQTVAGHLRTCLDSVGAAKDDIVVLRIYVVDLTSERGEEAFTPIVEFLGGVQPSITAIGVQALAGDDLQLEVEMVVRVPD